MMVETSEKPFIPAHSQLHKLRVSDLPPGAVLLTRDEVLKTQSDVIKKWSPSNQIWAFRNGPGVLGVCAAVTGIVINTMLRRKFGLFSAGRATTYLASVPIPVTLSMILSQIWVTTGILLKEETCPTCVHVRAVSIQTVTGFMQPIAMSLLACSAVARSTRATHVPSVTQPVQLVRVYAGLLRPMQGTLTLLLAANMISAVTVSHHQFKQAHIIHAQISRGVTTEPVQ